MFTSPDPGELPIDQEGVLKITGGTILAAGTPQEGEIIGQTTQIVKTYKEDIISAVYLIEVCAFITKISIIAVLYYQPVDAAFLRAAQVALKFGQINGTVSVHDIHSAVFVKKQ